MLAAISSTRFRPSSMLGIQKLAPDLTPIGREVPCGKLSIFAICSLYEKGTAETADVEQRKRFNPKARIGTRETQRG